MSDSTNLRPPYSGADIKCVWGLVCFKSIEDRKDNNISLITIVDQLNIPKDKLDEAASSGAGIFAPLTHEIVLLFRRNVDVSLCDDEIVREIKITLIDPRGDSILQIATPIVFPPTKRQTRICIQLPGFKITSRGDYIYSVEIMTPNGKDFEKSLEIPLQVLES